MNLQALAHEAHALAESKGFWDKTDWRANRNKLTLIHGEVSEAVDCVRKGDMETRYTEAGKPEGFPIELADIVLRTLDVLSAKKADLSPMAFHCAQECVQRLQFAKGPHSEAGIDASSPDGLVEALGALHYWIETEDVTYLESLRIVVNHVFDIAAACDLNLMEALQIKHRYNATRPHMHGRAL